MNGIGQQVEFQGYSNQSDVERSEEDAFRTTVDHILSEDHFGRTPASRTRDRSVKAKSPLSASRNIGFKP